MNHPRLRFALLLAATASLLFAPSAFGQNPPKQGEFTVQKFSPAIGPRNFITVEGARTDGKMAFSLGLFGNYGQNPLTITSCSSSTTCEGAGASELRTINVVETVLTGDLLASLTPIPRLQLGVRVPYTFVHGLGLTVEGTGAGQGSRTGLSGSGLGDPLFEAKIRAVGSASDKHVIGIALFGTAPVAHSNSSTKDTFIGDWYATFGGRAIYDVQFGRLNLAANLGGAYRKEALLGSAKEGSELRYGVGAGFLVSPILSVMAEGFGSVGLASSGASSIAEGELAAQLHPMSSKLAFTLGGGLGLIDGIGSPALRAFAGIAFVNEVADQDGDGIADDKDQCPTAAEDFDGFQDADGCPDPDNDGDGIADAQDKCPNDPETKNGFQDADGCPDEFPDRDKDGIPDAEDKCPDDGGPTVIHRQGEFYGCPDRDKDGIPDKIDKCPDEPEDTDGFQDADGCPDPDNDGDGILDVDDQCVDQPEIFNGFQDADGCPDEVPDRDHDGIPDTKDKCPDQPETFNGFQDEDGCPDGASLVDVGTEELKIKDVINFEKDSDRIVGKKSFFVLNAVVGALQHHHEIFKIEVAGHTDDKGDHDHNVDLSKRRAAAVVEYLTSKGVEARRLSSEGYGPDKPIADNKTNAGRAKNRRVEFRIVSSTKKSGAPTSTPPTSTPVTALPEPATEPTPPAKAPAKPAAKPQAPKPAPRDLGEF
jgi:outer membrane protein OmpA-like peptidoglycan-associated protein